MKTDYPHLEKDAKLVIDYALKHKNAVFTSIQGFQTDDEALKLRDFLQYAHDLGVEMHFVPVVKKHE